MMIHNYMREALRTRVFRFGFPTEEAKRHVLNFCFVYCLPRSLQLQDGLAANSDNEGIEDEAVVFDEDDLLEARLTHKPSHVRSKGKAQNAGSDHVLPRVWTRFALLCGNPPNSGNAAITWSSPRREWVNDMFDDV